MFKIKIMMLLSLLMLSRFTLAWPATITKTTGTGTLEVKLGEGSATGTTSLELKYTNSASFDSSNGGSATVACAVGDSADFPSGAYRDGFAIDLACPSSGKYS